MMCPWPLRDPPWTLAWSREGAGAGPHSCGIPEWAAVSQGALRREASLCCHVGCGGKQPPAAEAVGLIQWGPHPIGSPGLKGKPAVPDPELSLIVDLAASPLVPWWSSQTDSSRLPSGLGKGGLHYNNRNNSNGNHDC